MTDHAQALRRCAQGDQTALREIFEIEAPRLIAMAERILRRRDLAEDAVQEGFVQVWRRAAQFDPKRGSARGWIFTIIRHQALGLLRHNDRAEPLTEAHLDALQLSADLDRAWERLGETSRLRHCLGQLDERKRRSILMAHLYGFTHGEIAGRMNAPLGTVKAWIRRGLEALRECLS